MKLTRRQINILLALGALTVALFVGIFFLPHVRASGGPDPGYTVGADPHDRFRAPRSATSEYLDWEINLGGSGNEEVVASFKLKNEIIIFGNTTSIDYDFYGTNASENGSFFVMLLSSSGQPIAYRAHEGNLVKVLMVNQIREGFLLLINTATESFVIETNLFATDLLESDWRRSTNLRNLPHEQIIYLYVDDWADQNRTPAHMPYEFFHAVMEFTDPLDGFRRLRVAVLCGNLEMRYERFFTSTQSVEFVSAFAQMGEFVLFGTLRGGNNTSRLIGFRWSRATSVRNFTPILMQGVQNYTVETMIPAGPSEFVALIRMSNDVHEVVWFYNFFSETPRMHNISLSQSSAQKVLLMGGGQDRFYVFEVDILGRSVLYRFRHDNMRTMDSVPLYEFGSLNGIDSRMATNMGHGSVFIGRDTGYTVVIGTNDGGVTSRRFIEGSNKNIRHIIREDEHIGGFILIGESRGVGANVNEHFGESDVWVARLRI